MLTIRSTRNSRIVQARKLHRRRDRRKQGQFLVEGPTALIAALQAGHKPSQVFYCAQQATDDDMPLLLQRLQQTEIDVVNVSVEVIDSLSEPKVARGIVATLPLFEADLPTLAPGQSALIVVADQLQDPVNLGKIVHTAYAVGATGIVLLEPCVDPFDPPAVRESRGAILGLPLIRLEDANVFWAWCQKNGVRTVGAGAHRGKMWGTGILQCRVALVLGNEKRGLDKETAGQIDSWAHLPMAGKVESLNVAVAGGILMYLWLQENS